MEFKDYFSAQSDVYVKSRPSYPDELFQFLSTLVPLHDLAWDCATGNGQAAVSLAKYFNKVIATDASEHQIKNAVPDEKVEYYVALADNSGIESGTIDIVTIATALHWMDFDKFYTEVKRVLKPKGVFAAFAYCDPTIEPHIDSILKHFSKNIIGSYWPIETKHVFNNYVDIPFPFQPIPTPSFTTSVTGNFDYFYSYLLSWSGTQRYMKATGSNPLDLVRTAFENAWGDKNQTRKITWNLVLKVGTGNNY